MINCYAPTESADDDLKDAFYETLERTFNSIPSHSKKIVLGDMNAQIERERTFEKMAGKENFHLQSNNNGLRLVTSQHLKTLLLAVQYFSKKKFILRTTPDRKTKSQIDHILIDKKHKSYIKQVRTFRETDEIII